MQANVVRTGAILAMGFAAFHIGVTAYCYRAAFARTPLPGISTPQREPQESAARQRRRELREQGVTWLQAQPFENVSVASADSLKLHGRFFPAEGEAHGTIIAVHGWRSTPEHCFAASARFYHDLGWNLLFLDNRGSGQSEGRVLGMGWPDRLDLVRWAQWAAGRNPDKPIVLLGMSMGAAAVMMASGESLPPQVAGIIADCGYVALHDELMHAFPKDLPIPKRPTIAVASTLNRLCQGFWFHQATALPALSRNSIPLLVIHGTADTFSPVENAYRAAAATAGPVSTFIVEGAGHLDCYTFDTAGYEAAVTGFLESISS